MKAADILESMGRIDDAIVWEVVNTMYNKEKTVSVRRPFRSLLAAALLVSLFAAFCAAAYAFGSFHQQRKEELKQQLAVEQNQVAGYVEYEQENTQGVTLLSAIANGDFQEVYVNISPVREEDVSLAGFAWSLDGGNSGGTATIPFDKGKLTDADRIMVHNEQLGTSFQAYDPQAIRRLMLEESYEAESQTLTLQLQIPQEMLDGKDGVELCILRMTEEGEILHNYGSVPFAPTAVQLREILFAAPVAFEHEALRESGQLVGLRLTPTGMHWLAEIPGGEEFLQGNADTPEKQEKLMSWIGCLDELLGESKLLFADGSEKEVYAGESFPYENGRVHGSVQWAGTIDIHAVTAVEVQGQKIELD